MIEYGLNIIGSEWIIIIFVALILLFGTNKLPEAGKKIGKIVGEYNKAKNNVQKQFKDYTESNSSDSNLLSIFLSSFCSLKLSLFWDCLAVIAIGDVAIFFGFDVKITLSS